MYSYAAYGLTISSSIALPGLPVCPLPCKSPADVVIQRGRVGGVPTLSDSISGGDDFRVTPPGIFLFWRDIATIFASYAGGIIIEPASGTNGRLLRSIIVGHGIPVVLFLKGRFVMHASAVAVGRQVAVFMGNPGAGKSTLALALCSFGHQLVADDIVSVDLQDQTPLVYPAYPEINAWPEALTALSYDPAAHEEVAPTAEKRIVSLQENWVPTPQPLHRIYMLERGETTRMEDLSPGDAFLALTHHSFHTKLHVGDENPVYFSQCVQLARTIPMRRLTVARSLEQMRAVAHRIELDVEH